jgi:hypothetical protein
MDDERLGRAAGQWLRDIDSPPPDSQRSVERALQQVRQTDQVRRWWPFAVSHRRARQTTTPKNPQPGPILAIDDHTPTFIGRTQLMFSPAKAITAGALVFAIGSAVLIAQPLGRQGGDAPGATTDASTQALTEFTGHIACGPEVRRGTSASNDSGLFQARGFAWQPSASISDPRLAGDYYISYDTDDYGTTTVGTGTWRIENAQGAWQGSFTNINFPDHTTTVSTPLVGEGGYEGLTAHWESVNHPETSGVLCSWDVRGVIIEGEPPAAPEPFTGE